MKKQAFNPYLPSYEYVPDGEPHVFGDRVYIYGSHDRFNGEAYCMNDYICYSAPVDDLANWRYEGVIYKKIQDPYNDGSHPGGKHDRGVIDGVHCMYAPDVCKGTDGKYYLYYCLDNIPQIAVAVCDTPCGKFEFLSYVKDENGNIIGRRDGDRYPFDPGVLVDDDGKVYLYFGNSAMLAKPEFFVKRAWPNNHSMVMELESDMFTVKTGPKDLIPSITEAVGTDFEGHALFEASSIRKVGNTYYFVYSDVNCHNLCYATSDKPMEGFKYGGVLVSNGDIGLDGRTASSSPYVGRRDMNPTTAIGNNHGGMAEINGQWYIFYHRQTNCHDHSRQTCAEKIYIEKDGSIKQVEITSCGLNDGALRGEGKYPSYIACALWNKDRHNGFSNRAFKNKFPYITQDGVDREEGDDQYVANLRNGFYVGYKYFDFDGLKQISVSVRGKGKGVVEVYTSPDKAPVCKIAVEGKDSWTRFVGNSESIDGTKPLYFRYVGKGALQFNEFELIK